MLDKIVKLFSLDKNKIINLYPYGSRIYGTNRYNSDYDFILIYDDNNDKFSLEKDNFNLHLYNINSFQEQLNKHKISSLECFFLPKEKVLINNYNFTFKLNKSKLRSSISEKASHSWVKAKKKLEIEKDKNILIAKKSLFHSFRIIDFGTQIATHNKIIDYSSSNDLWTEIFNNNNESWKYFYNKYKRLHNSKLIQFRKVCPK